ncbi:MAG: kinase [Hyphomonas sp.]|uniref:hypothetical protein n=1 Tax=Hyphomonas sp. TaxID=87 RepID=UPI001DAB74CA|nr:hypothetical protein [Hyphomonas sp.]MBA4228102.1 kinase [Hyphomonas sp.]
MAGATPPASEPPSEIAPLVAAWIRRAVEAAPSGRIPLLFLSGAQGSGKSTALRQAVSMLPEPVAKASLDDFYLTQAERAELARRISPLLATRGPPGTHDLALLRETVARLRAATDTSETVIPAFDKLADDRAAHETWPRFSGRPAAIVIEGWMMGALPDAGAADAPPLNAVEAEDSSGVWRRFQEEALAGDYAALWDSADGFCHILAPGFDAVLSWRLEQEAALWQARGEAMPAERRAWTERFIQHYERITRRMLSGGRRPGADIPVEAQRRVRPPPS